MPDNGNTYFESHYNGYLARVKAATALQANPTDPATLDLVKQADAASRKADDLLAGEATRGLLLAGYGFSVIGDRLAQAALVCFVCSGTARHRRHRPAGPVEPQAACLRLAAGTMAVRWHTSSCSATTRRRSGYGPCR
jgi:hypothetical protein